MSGIRTHDVSGDMHSLLLIQLPHDHDHDDTFEQKFLWSKSSFDTDNNYN
jgi:hypothetical protein